MQIELRRVAEWGATGAKVPALRKASPLYLYPKKIPTKLIPIILSSSKYLSSSYHHRIDVYSILQCSFPPIYQFTISWHPKKVYFSLLTHTTHILSKLKKRIKGDVDNSLSWKDQKQKKYKDFQELFEVLLKVWEIFAAGLRLLNCTYAVLIAEGKKLIESIIQMHRSVLLSDLPLAF